MSKQARLRKAYSRMIKKIYAAELAERMNSTALIHNFSDELRYVGYYCRRMRDGNYRGTLTFKQWKKQWKKK